MGIPIDGEAIVGTTDKVWATECRSMLGINPTGTVLQGQRILIKKLLDKIDQGLPDDAAEVDVHRYARCYILALLADTIFADKSGDRVHMMWLQMLSDLRNPPQYSWGSACLAWLYKELCRATDRGASQIGRAANCRDVVVCTISSSTPTSARGSKVTYNSKSAASFHLSILLNMNFTCLSSIIAIYL